MDVSWGSVLAVRTQCIFRAIEKEFARINALDQREWNDYRFFDKRIGRDPHDAGLAVNHVDRANHLPVGVVDLEPHRKRANGFRVVHAAGSAYAGAFSAHRFRPRRMSAQLGGPSGALVASMGIECPPGRGPAHRVGSSLRWAPRPARGWLRDSPPRRVEPPGDPFGSGASRSTDATLAPRRGCIPSTVRSSPRPSPVRRRIPAGLQ